MVVIEVFTRRIVGLGPPAHLDHIFFWNAVDLIRKLNEYRDYYNNPHRVHRSLKGTTQRYAPVRRRARPGEPSAALLGCGTAAVSFSSPLPRD